MPSCLPAGEDHTKRIRQQSTVQLLALRSAHGARLLSLTRLIQLDAHPVAGGKLGAPEESKHASASRWGV